VVLVVTDDVGAGQKGTTSQQVPVGSTGGTPLPTASFVFSPTSPATNQDVFFNASSSRAAAGHSITAYQWDFGDGFTCLSNGTGCGSGTPQQPRHAYIRAGNFTVTLTVTDDVGTGQKGTTSQQVSVSAASGQIVPEFVFSPTDPIVLQTVFFDSTPSIPSAGASINTYTWDFGDGNTCQNNGTGCGAGTPQKPQHAFASANTFVVRLTVTDTAGKSATTTHNVTVRTPPTFR
jgi:PKD repeat protein